MAHQNRAPVKILIIDDNQAYVEALHRDAQRRGIALLYAGSLEEGRELFEQQDNWTLSGIILDVKCLKERQQQVPDNSFITAAVRYFSEKAAHLPMVVLTGEPDQFRNLSELYAGTLQIFSKGRDEAGMFAFLVGQAEKLDYVRISRAHADVFSVVSRYLGPEAEQELLSCLRDMTNPEPATIRNTLVCVRRLEERIYIALSRADASLLPPHLVAGEINLVGCYKHLVEKGVVERYRIIDRFAELIYKITSENGSHIPYATLKYPPTPYTVQTVIYALLDLLLWFRDIMSGNRNQTCTPS
jgi:ActR/RegA family two-component response regulator